MRRGNCILSIQHHFYVKSSTVSTSFLYLIYMSGGRFKHEMSAGAEVHVLDVSCLRINLGPLYKKIRDKGLVVQDVCEA